MRKIREVLRLKHELQLTYRQIACSCGIARTTVTEYVSKANHAGLAWPLPEGFDDLALEKLLFPIAIDQRTKPPLPDWGGIRNELTRKGVTLQLLWTEYKEKHANGLSYSRFCELYREFTDTLEPWMRQMHVPGEKLFVDYAGMTIPIINADSGEIVEAQIFVAVLGASNYTYVEATLSQTLSDWTASHVRAFEFFQGVPVILVPDNLRSGVSQAHRYDPDCNPTYYDMAKHYGVAILPARVRKPKDKSKAEVGVQGVERQILAPLRDRQFFLLLELNQELRIGLNKYNGRAFQKLEGSRQSQFESIEKPALQPLPLQAYQFSDWRRVRVGMNYHVEVEKHHYSVPYRHLKKMVDVRITATVIEIFYKSQSIALHIRSNVVNGYTTVKEHMPKSHQAYLEWTPDKVTEWSNKNGVHTHALMQRIVEERDHPQQALRICVGIIRLAKTYGPERLENACARALDLHTFRYQSIESILKSGLDTQPLPTESFEIESSTPLHHNIRGAAYYSEKGVNYDTSIT